MHGSETISNKDSNATITGASRTCSSSSSSDSSSSSSSRDSSTSSSKHSSFQIPASFALALLFYDPMASLSEVQIPVAFYATQDDDSGVHQYAAAAKRGHFISFEAVGCQKDSLLQGIAEYGDLAGVQEKINAGLKTGLEGLEGAQGGVSSPGLAEPEASLQEVADAAKAGSDATAAASEAAAAEAEAGAEADASSNASSSSAGSSSDSSSGGSSCSPEQVEFVLVDQGVLLNMLLDPDALGAASSADSTQGTGIVDAISRKGQEAQHSAATVVEL